MANLETILIIDDDVALTKVLRAELQSVGYNIEVINDGQEALERLTSEYFDLILLDLKMPNLDGFDVLKELQKRGYPGKVIVLTAYADVENAIQAKKLGARSFLAKPFDFYELLVTIQKVLHSE